MTNFRDYNVMNAFKDTFCLLTENAHLVIIINVPNAMIRLIYAVAILTFKFLFS